MEFKSINPYNNKEVSSYIALSKEETSAKLNNAQNAFTIWRKVPLAERVRLIQKAGQVLRDNVGEYAQMITLEMGKPIAENPEQK
jgi:succinate-semialdehyde dehydrogenase/glutarate-semialdehyde dehydrogenase